MFRIKRFELHSNYILKVIKTRFNQRALATSIKAHRQKTFVFRLFRSIGGGGGGESLILQIIERKSVILWGKRSII